MSLKSILFAAMPFVAACASSASDAIDQPEPEPALDLEGKTGTIPVKHAWGVQLEEYVVVEGEVIIRGDIIVGRAEELQTRSTAMVGGRWPKSQVRYAFDVNYPLATKTVVRDALEELEAQTPIDFIEIDNPCVAEATDCAIDYVLLMIWDKSYGVSALGHKGGQQRIRTPIDFSETGFQHEFFHAIGRYHEQQRSDRDSYVDYNAECVQEGKTGNFSKNADAAANFGSYTFDTIMHYNSWSFVLDEPERSAAPCNGGWTLERIAGSCPLSICSDEDGNGSREYIDRPNAPSTHDIDVLWAMYGLPLGAHEAGDGYATVIAHGDFDDDGRRDVAFGIPSEDTSVANAGAVMVYKGTEEGFQPWELITQSSIGANEEANDNLGTALAVGDFNDDGIDDLAIGTPGESVGSNPDAGAGAVYLMQGTTNGLAFWRSVTQANVGSSVEGGDRFGHALAVGDFSGDGIDDLAVGSPGETHGDDISAGHVHVLNGTGADTALAAWSDVSQASLSVAPNVALGGIVPPPEPLGTNQSGDGFGAALASGRIDEDAIDDLVVGADCDDEVAPCAGGAYLYRGAGAGMRGWMRVSQGTGSDAFDRFGWTVATGDIDMDGDDDVLVGAPYDDYGGAADVGRVYIAKPNDHVIASNAVLSQSGTGSDAGTSDHFGASIAFGNNGVFDVIAIGARNEAWSTGPASGAVFIFNASDSGNIGYQETLRASPASDELAEDAFGTSVAVFTQGGRDYLFVGNPLEDNGAGSAQVFVAAPVGTAFEQDQLLLQTTKGTRP